MRKIESTTIKGESGESYPVNIYPADMRFNDFIPGVFLLFAGKETLYMSHSDNVDQWLQRRNPVTHLANDGFSSIGFIRHGNPEAREAIVADLGPAVSPRLKEL